MIYSGTVLALLAWRRISAAVLLPIFILLLGGCFDSRANDSLLQLNGAAVDLETNTIIAVNYWAPWCKPCLEEIPELNAFAATEQVTVLGVNFDSLNAPLSNIQLVQQAEQLGIQFPVLDSASSQRLEQQWSLPRPPGLPATYLLNSQGQVLDTLLGPQTQHELNAAFQKIFVVKPAH